MSAISTATMTREEWLAERRNGIGGSDAGAIAGLSPYATPLSVYEDKLGLVSEKEETDAMHFGQKLEDVVAREWMDRTGLPMRRDNKIRIHAEHPFIRANVDRIITTPDGPGILEIKTASAGAFKGWVEDGWEVAPWHYAQLQHYLAVTGYGYGEIAYLVDGRRFSRHSFLRDDGFISELIETEVNFWRNHVTKRVPPPPVNGDEVRRLYPQSKFNETVEASEEAADACRELKQIKAQIKDLEARERKLTDSIQMLLGEAEALVLDGVPLCTWKTAKESQRFDTKRFEAEHAGLYQKYLVSQPGSRRFLVK